MAKTVKALDRLLEEGLFGSGKDALSAIMAGEVTDAAGRRITSAGQMVSRDAHLCVRGREMPYVAKGGLKLEGALKDFALSPAGRVCIDAGASTGGFTHCLVRSGAALVYAVDVGYGQLMGSLRQDPRVVNMEKTNISDPQLLCLDPRPDLGTVDLSYLSLRLGIPAFSDILHRQGDLICLVKPLFETEDTQARRTGVLPDTAYGQILEDLVRDIDAMPDTAAVGVTHSPVTGNAGTREFFVHVALGPVSGHAPDLSPMIRIAVDRALALREYEKKK